MTHAIERSIMTVGLDSEEDFQRKDAEKGGKRGGKERKRWEKRLLGTGKVHII